LGKGLFNRLQGELNAREKSPGLTMADLLTLPDPLSGLLNWMLRASSVTLTEVITFLNQDEASVRAILADLLERGFIREIELRGATQYRVRLAPKRGRDIPSNLWQALDGKVEEKES
jgi:hypothetical protein